MLARAIEIQRAHNPKSFGTKRDFIEPMAGVRQPNRKQGFTDDEVRAIRTSPLSGKELATLYRCGESVICRIRNYQSYGDVE